MIRGYERELHALGIPYALRFVEDDPDVVSELGVSSSPSLAIDGKVVFRQPISLTDLKAYFHQRR